MDLDRLIDSLSITTLQPDAVIPTRRWMHEHHGSAVNPRPNLPHAHLYTGPDGRPLPVAIWVDWDGQGYGGYVYTEPDCFGGAWMTHEERIHHLRRDEEVMPEFVRAHEPNFGSTETLYNRLMIRHPLTPERAELVGDLLAEHAPPVERYPVPTEAAQVFRRAGWDPFQVDQVRRGWRIITAEDAAVFAAHSYRWWWHRHFPIIGPHRTRDLHGEKIGSGTNADTPFTAADAARIIATGTRFDVVTAYIEAGRTDVEEMIAARPPHIPDEATRTRLGDGSYLPPSYALDATAARHDLNRWPSHWLRPIEVDTTPGLHLLHYCDERRWVLWSDGRLDRGTLIVPPDVEPGEEMRAWLTSHTHPGISVVADLITSIMESSNRADLSPELWLGWRQATGVEAVTEAETTEEFPVALHITARLTLTLTRHTITRADADPHTVWLVIEDMGPGEGTFYHVHGHNERWLFTEQEEARRHYERLAVVTPRAVTTDQLAERLGVTRNAITQAVKRARDRRTPGRRPPQVLYVGGEGRWVYATRKFLDWWHARPGHGPGRGHREPVDH